MSCFSPQISQIALIMENPLNKMIYQIIGCAYKVHQALGPGLLESSYESCLVFELLQLGYIVEKQVPLPILYHDIKLENGYRIDIWVNRQVIIELKAIEALLPVHKAQLLTYLKLSGSRLGLLINFNVDNLQKGIVRMVN